MAKLENPCELLEPVSALANDAGQRIMSIYNKGFSVQQKEDRSPLTEADMAAHNAIVAGLSLLTPEIPILSEESSQIPFEERSKWNTYWLVDPLDGTREFIKRNGEFTVNIALIEDHKPILGVIVVPVSGLCYFACKGKGAFKKMPGKAPEQIKVRAYDPKSIVVAGSRSHRSDGLSAFLANVGEHEYISMGSSLKSCLVAEGKADVYARIGLTSEWDTAAAHCIVEAAGGRITDTDMDPLLYNTKESLLNPHFFVSGDLEHDWSKYLEN
ncbi:MAG: 3'(2'),5'-bisphosphate nucleotidase CysQ [Gammaproteobacteria bacterium]